MAQVDDRFQEFRRGRGYDRLAPDDAGYLDPTQQRGLYDEQVTRGGARRRDRNAGINDPVGGVSKMPAPGPADITAGPSKETALKYGSGYAETPVDAQGRPLRPKWDSLIDVTTGQLKEPLQLQAETPSAGLEAFKAEALREGPSAWRNLMGQQLEQQLGQQRDLLGRQQAGALTQAQNRLAMTGGLRGGAGERMAGQMAKQGLLGQQALSSKAQELGTQFDIADEMKRMQMLGALPGQELASAQFGRGTDQFNIEQALREENLRRVSSLEAYKEAMKGWGAEQTARAAAAAGEQGPGMLDRITGIHEQLDPTGAVGWINDRLGI